MGRLLSVNVGLPRDVAWNGRAVRTAIWKYARDGRCRVGKLNLEGDGQGDLSGHGGEHRPVYVYQIECYRHWEKQLKRRDFVYGQFGENFTTEGMCDDLVCIGDRYRIGTALFEVSQPRVTCYRVGIRMNDTRMPALLTSSCRTGFYLRVLCEGEVGAGDEIVRVADAADRMSVAEINALLYLPNHSRDRLERALRIEALSPGWRSSFKALLQADNNPAGGNAGLAPPAALHPAPPGFFPLVITSIVHESADVISFTMQSAAKKPLPTFLPGQHVVVRLQQPATGSQLLRSYSLSGPISADSYRISVKIEPTGAAGKYLRDAHVGDALDVSFPRGSFTLETGEQPVVLLSAGIGVTPLLAMLHALAATGSARQVVWLHAARDAQHHPFAAEVRRLVGSLLHGRSYVLHSRPDAAERIGVDFDAVGHFSQSAFDTLALPRDADVYLCGPNRFMADMKEALRSFGVALERIHVEMFDNGHSMTASVLGGSSPAPHLPKDETGDGPVISFARSGIAAHWSTRYQSILEMAEACDVPVRWSCRTGVCHNCESGLVSGRVAYEPEPLDKPAEGNVLICCSQPSWDIVLDL